MKITEEQKQSYRFWLQQEFIRKTALNPKFSVRSFSKQLGLNSGTLSQILAGKRPVTSKLVRSLEPKLGLPPQFNLGDRYNFIDEETITIFTHWYHYAILELSLIKGFKSDVEWISKKLDIPKVEVGYAIERLLRVGLLTNKNGKLIKTQKFLTNYTGAQTSAAHKEYQRQLIQKALIAVDECPQEDKDITSITMPTNKNKLEEAREKIKKFRRELSAFLEDCEADSVYQFTMQLFPVTKD
jgi:uncharacterized protein (TIGR02147 family)